MESHRMKEEYDAAFRAFLLCTNEKEILSTEIARRIQQREVSSLLDIGAGGGELAILLASLVERYCAIEQKRSYAASLRRAGLRVIESSFPVAIEAQFDLVLVSHALPWHSAEYEPFLQKAWGCVASGGILLGITYDGMQSEWRNFLIACGLSRTASNVSRIEKLSAHLSTLGPTKVDTVTTFVSAASRGEMLSALSFVYSDGREEKQREFEARSAIILQYLTAHHHDGEEYRFPFHHLFLETHKR